MVLDIAGNRPLSQLRQVLPPHGTLVIVGGSGGKRTMGRGRTIRAALLSPFARQRLVAFLSVPIQDDLRALAQLMESGKLPPVIESPRCR